MSDQNEPATDNPAVVDATKQAPGPSIALNSIVLDLAPELGTWLFGKDAISVQAAVGRAVAEVTGADDPGSQLAKLADPARSSALRIELARVAAERASASMAAGRSALAEDLRSIVEARQPELSQGTSQDPVGWGAPVVSVVVLATFGGVIALTLTRAMPSGAEAILNVLMGTLGAMATSVVSYWVGSSAGSARKDARLASLAER